MADLTPEQQAAAEAAAAEKAALEAAKAEAAKWKGKTYAELADEHNRLLKLYQFDQAAAFHRQFVKTFKDK